MRMLLMNTCGAEGVVALAEETAVLAMETLPGRATSEHLMPAIKRLFGGQGARVHELGALVVVNGPGSFTGVRVGLSAAKGLCEAGAVPLIALSRLALVAGSIESGAAKVIALLDAGRGEFYSRLTREPREASGPESISEELLRMAEVRLLLAGRVGVTCEARVVEMLDHSVRLVDEPGPEEMLTMARARIAIEDWDDVALVDANYLRRTDAELLVNR